MSSSVKYYIFSAVVLVLAGISLFTGPFSESATYNFYFNNVEQGDNSNATPNVTISEDGVKKTDGKEGDKQDKLNLMNPNSNPPPASGPNSVAQINTETLVPYTRHTYRLGILGGPTWGLGHSTLNNDGRLGVNLELAWTPSRDIGINFFVGGLHQGTFVNDGGTLLLGGAEIEWTPIRISIGRIENMVDVGFLLGASSLAAAPDNWVSAHTGTRIALNLGEDWSALATGRINLGFVSGQVGLAYRF